MALRLRTRLPLPIAPLPPCADPHCESKKPAAKDLCSRGRVGCRRAAPASWGRSPRRLTPTRCAHFPARHPPRLRGSVAMRNAPLRPAHGRRRLCHPGSTRRRLRAAASTADSGRVVRSRGPRAHATVVRGSACSPNQQDAQALMAPSVRLHGRAVFPSLCGQPLRRMPAPAQ